MRKIHDVSARRIREARLSKGWSQAELAKQTTIVDKIGVTAAAIGNFEQATRCPSHHTAGIFERLFGLPSCYWLGLMTREEAEVVAALRRTV